ncbi:MAG: ABC transporter permease [Candidatus Limnocylindria bacterium]
MNPVVARLTLRQLLGRRRSLLLVAIGALMVLVAVLYRLGSPSPDEMPGWTTQLLATFGVATLLPIVALIVGTGALGAEIDEGTIVHLLAKPVPRGEIVLSKLVVVIAITALLTSVPMVLGALVAGGSSSASLAVGFGVASVAGCAVYAAIFMALSLVTGRALILGLAYVLLWEGFLAALFAGTRVFSVRQHTLAIADELADVAEVVGETLDPVTALVVGGVTLVAATALAIRRLSTFEIRGEEA